MSKQITISIYLILLSCVLAAYLEGEGNYFKPKLERNNIVNKGLWIRGKTDKRNTGDFIFRTNSLDADNFPQTNYDEFAENNMASSPFASSYFERNKRSASREPNYHFRDSIKCDDKSKCPQKIENQSSIVKSKLISTLKPASVFNDYPYEVAVILNKNQGDKLSDNSLQDVEFYDKYKEEYEIESNETAAKLNPKLNKNSISINDSIKIIIPENSTLSAGVRSNNSLIMPKRSMNQHKYETELIKKLQFTEDQNNTLSKENKGDRNAFDPEEISWQNTEHIPNINVYKILPKQDENVRNKPLNERGLIKVVSMLTKTFKKIMKQHNDIKRIHNKLYDLNGNFMKTTDILTKKFEDFNSKYTHMLKVNEELKLLEGKLVEKQKSFNIKEKGFSKNLKEFESQQKKFLLQQQQFYNVQKLMLAQNEKINLKQNVIAKTQSEISHRQNNFARILKKAKQIYIDSKNLSPIKLNSAIAKSKEKPTKERVKPVNLMPTTTVLTTKNTVPEVTTETVKINLFSIPTLQRLRNQDQMILDEKDYQPVDDLIYKYYFNNTFIDDIMRNKILATLVTASETTDNNITKNKRNESAKLKTTLLLPVNVTKVDTNKKNRNRRWIKRSKKTGHKRNDEKTTTATINKKVNKDTIVGNSIKPDFTKMDKKITKDSPFTTMALNFCKEIGQTVNMQVLNWCIEKVLRRLQIIDLKIPQLMTPPDVQMTDTTNKIIGHSSTISVPETTPIEKLQDPILPKSTTTETVNTGSFFPDNDELEIKLKEYEIKPDIEGTVYYDGSLHSSDLGHLGGVDSEGFSDIMPGLDSDSRVQVDPLAFDLQAQRRADVRKINERIMKTRMV